MIELLISLFSAIGAGLFTIVALVCGVFTISIFLISLETLLDLKVGRSIRSALFVLLLFVLTCCSVLTYLISRVAFWLAAL